MRSCDKVKGPALTGCKVVIAGCAMLRGRLEARPQQEGLALLTQHYVLCHCLSNLQCRLESWHQVSSPMSHPQVLRSGGPTALTFQKARKPLLSSRELSLLPTNCPLPLITCTWSCPVTHCSPPGAESRVTQACALPQPHHNAPWAASWLHNLALRFPPSGSASTSLMPALSPSENALSTSSTGSRSFVLY